MKSLVARLRRLWTETLFAHDGPTATPLARMSPRDWGAFLLLTILAGVLLFHGLAYPLIEPDEGRYAEIGREMASSGDWIVPHFNHEPYLDKPPLFYWLVGICVKIFGAHAWSARLVPSMSTFLTVLAVFFFGQRVVGVRRALFGALAATLMGGVVLSGRMLILDATFTLTIVLALFTGHEAIRGRFWQWRWWLLSAACCGLGVLAKGPVAVILAVVPLWLHGWLHRTPAAPRLHHWLAYSAVIALIVAPWFVAISIRCPEFPHYFFVNQHLVRYLGQEHHPAPIWFYVPVLFGGCAPWSGLFLPLALFLLSRKAAFRALRTRPMGFLCLWAGWCVLFFSLSRGKLPPYILPALYPLALLFGCYLDILFFDKSVLRLVRWVHRWVPRPTAATLTACWFALILLSWYRNLSAPGQFGVEIAEISLCVLVIVGLVTFGRALPTRAAWLLSWAVGVCVLLEITNGFVPEWSLRRSPLRMTGEINRLFRDPNICLALLADYGSVPFHFNEDRRFFPAAKHTAQEVKDFLAKHERSVLVTDNDIPLSRAQRFLPREVLVERFFNSGKTRFFVLRNKRPTLSSFAALP